MMSRWSAVRWAARRRPLVVDGVLAGVLCVLAIGAAQLAIDEQRRAGILVASSDVELVVAMAAVTLPLALRRRAPIAAALAASVALVGGRVVLDVSEQIVSVLALYLAFYSAARHSAGRARVIGLVVSSAIVVADIVYEIFAADQATSLAFQLMFFTYNLVLLALPLWLGVTMRSRQAREEQLVAQADELRREREENAKRAVFDERVRIARELHDVVAHHVSVMGIQAGAARHVLERRPDRAEEALVGIERASRQAVAEMDRLLGFLRQEGDTDATAPQPRLSDLSALVDDVGSAGLAVQLCCDVGDRPIPRTVELSAFRIVQEALTNTLKHAGASKVDVAIVVRGDDLEVRIEDDGAGMSASDGHGGHGLIGMRERVGVHGGRLRAGPKPAGGFSVCADLPITEAR